MSLENEYWDSIERIARASTASLKYESTRLGTIDPAFTGLGNPRVQFDGEPVLDVTMTKTYTHLVSYTPVASDRVLLERINSNWVILGKVSGASLNLTPGQLVFRARRQATQSISNTTDTKVGFDTEVLDVLNCFTATADEYIPTVAGTYEVWGGAGFASNGTGVRSSWVALNGTGVNGSTGSVPGSSAVNTKAQCGLSIVSCNGLTDAIQIYCYQNSGGSLNTSSTAIYYPTMFVKYLGA